MNFQRLNYPLDMKIELSLNIIKNFYKFNNGEMYISFSGGKDSTVLLDLVRSIYPKTIGVFSNTGLEYPEIVKFVKTIDNIIWIKPELNFKKVIEKYGYPIISKEQSGYIEDLRNTKSKKIINKRLNSKFQLSEKWRYLLDAPFKISNKCCKYLKINPFKKFEKETNMKALLGITFDESYMRNMKFYKEGCNVQTKREYGELPLPKGEGLLASTTTAFQ